MLLSLDFFIFLVRSAGFEPAAYGFRVRCLAHCSISNHAHLFATIMHAQRNAVGAGIKRGEELGVVQRTERSRFFDNHRMVFDG